MRSLMLNVNQFEEFARLINSNQFELGAAFGAAVAGFFTVVPAAGLAPVPVPEVRMIEMWTIFTGRNGLSFEGSRSIRAIFFTSSTLASSHWPKIV